MDGDGQLRVYSSTGPGGNSRARCWVVAALAVLIGVPAALFLWPREAAPESVERLQTELAALRTQVEQMRQQMAALRSQGQAQEKQARRLSGLFAVINGGFEESDGERPLFWLPEWHMPPTAPPALDRQVKHGGAQSLRYGTGNLAANHIRHRQLVPVEPHSNYVLKGWIKASDIRPDHRRGDGGAHLRVNAGPAVRFSPPIYDTADWQQVALEFPTGEARAVEVSVELGYFGNLAKGTVWFDDVQLEPFAGPPAEEGEKRPF